MSSSAFRRLSLTLLYLFCILPILFAQDPSKRPIDTPEGKAQAEAAREHHKVIAAGKDRTQAVHDLTYQKWLDDDALWIVTDSEVVDYKKLTTDKQHDDFIEAFWERRNPNPGSTENTFKEEHYRRIAYANTHFGAGIPGFRTDRGHLYVVYGTPDSILSHPTHEPPSEIWHYRRIKGVRPDILLRFVDPCKCGYFRLVENRTDKTREASN